MAQKVLRCLEVDASPVEIGRVAVSEHKLTSQTTGESHILVTDENGEVRTETKWNPHSQNTNGNDNTENYDDQAGTWFGLSTWSLVGSVRCV